MNDLKNKIAELLNKTANELPEDVWLALKKSEKEEKNPGAKKILEKILENAAAAKNEQRPICQDTGTPFFYVRYSSEFKPVEISRGIKSAVKKATQKVPLRPNAVDALTGKNIGNLPVIHFEEIQKKNSLEINLLLKGGGSENVSSIYSLPKPELNASRNLDGVRKVILDAVFKAQGKACPPYVIGAALAGNQEQAAGAAKKQLLRKLNDANPVAELNKLEEKVLAEINSLGIGPMGLGGKTTALGLKITAGVRHPASFFVGISISCWALRRHFLKFSL